MKKLIAILLVLAALMGVCSAAFTDEKEITDTYAEAVNAMVEAKVISGFPDGTFQPKGTLTRAQAAKIICVMLEGDKAETVTAAAAGFTDVPAGNWAEKYVNYCAEKKIVAGVGNGKFDPNGQLKGSQWAKMLLVAYGHDATELTGEKWFTNTQKAIREKGMNKNAFTSDAPTNREKACQLAFNFYHNTKVQEFETTVLAPAGYKETTFSLEGGKNVRLLGRAQATDKGIKTNFPADGMEFTLDCGGTLTLTISATDTANTYRTFIDGEAVSFAPTKSKEVVLTEMLQPGMHTIRIVQDKEINTSGKINTISAITVSAKGGEMKATAPAKYLIEFIGASTEAGCGTLGGVNDTWSSDYHSVTSSHTYKLGQLLGADVNVVAKGGIGLVAKSGKHATEGLYFFHNGYASDEVYKPTRKPDVIAINTPCSNDKGDYSSKEELLEKGRAFVKKLIEVNGTDVHYVFFGGHMVGKNPSASTQEISEVKKQLAKEFGFPFVTLPNGPNGVPAKAGGTPHPSAEDGTKQAEAFAEYLKTVLK